MANGMRTSQWCRASGAEPVGAMVWPVIRWSFAGYIPCINELFADIFVEYKHTGVVTCRP